MFKKGVLKSGLGLLVLLWLAAHAVLLGLILSVKFLAAKTVLLLAMMGAAAWFLLGRKPRIALPPPPGMV